MSGLDFAKFVIVGLIAGIAAGSFGIGGGIIIVPTMMFLGLPITHAIAMSIMQMIFSSIFGSYINYKKRNFDLKDGIFIGIGGLIGASFSGILLSVLSDVVINALFLSLNLVAFYRFAFKIKPQVSATPPNLTTLKKNVILICAGMVTGVFAISLGIGGGLLISPILAYYLGYDSKKVVPLSLFFVIFSSVSGTASLYRAGVLSAEAMQGGLSIGLASLVGVAVGIYLVGKVSGAFHRNALICIYIYAICLMSYKLGEKIFV
ncbi:sulfite exporter TauE/SafE family protein [Helicobacter sp. MIT 01-3238]|uniref:sulfite exporter TauE/SafE family protein n=1 Tax=Helicobacter sp. MIT 01-3238 TaxID=398627 RepID=UPI000E1EAFBE|nr:sulfite exporter TauE/SafE family protein [Helicobacter sp. MIT 01-3238]RDU51704.1 hypothetical protein CQA40_09390 [Helicobacter sp. MIT 01-3238]